MKDYKAKKAKVKANGVKYRKPGSSFQECSQSRITGTRWILPATVTTCVKCCLLGSSLDTEAKDFVEPDHVGTLSSMYSNSRLPEKKADIQYKPHCFYTWLRHSEPLVSFRKSLYNIRNFSSQILGHKPRVNLTSRPF